MNIVKLNAINSTNTFLKDLVKKSTTKNWTVVVTENQTSGKGQLKNKWSSKKGKNLTFSVLCKFNKLNIENSFYLNCAISLAIYNVLKGFIPAKLSIKWPNDILSFQKKICGILIENTVSNGKVLYAIIGIGLNVNQEKFPKNLPNATSLKIITNQNFNKNELLKLLVEEIKTQVELIVNEQFVELKKSYENVLYRINEPAMFKNNLNRIFLGKIKGITNQGKLMVELENETIETYDLKEIKFI